MFGFGDKTVKMGQGLAEWATTQGQLSDYKSATELYNLSKVENARFLLGIDIVHIVIAIWVVNNTFKKNPSDMKSIIDSIVARFMDQQAKIKSTFTIDKLVVYKPEMAYLVEKFNVLSKDTTNVYTLTDMLIKFRYAEYANALNEGFTDEERLNNPVGLGPTGPLTRTFARHVMGDTEEKAFIVGLPLLLLERINYAFKYCSNKAKDINRYAEKE